MATINGVLGPIDTRDLGFTLMHEHVLCTNWSMRMASDRWVDSEALVQRAVEQMKAAAERGVKTIVDVTTINLGRDIHIIREVAEKAEMQMVAATGFYYQSEPWMHAWPEDRLVEYLIDDIEKGIQGTDSKAGIIKCATGEEGGTAANEKLLRVAARLHKATGVPITTHTDVSVKAGLFQQDIFEDEGVDLSTVIIGHSGDSDDLDYLESLLGRGSFIGMDRFGIDAPLDTAQRVVVVAELCRRGWSERMVLSHDACCQMDWFPPDVFKTIQDTIMPNWNFRHIPDDVLPALREAAIGEEQIATLTTGNPRRFFEAS